MGFTEQQRAQLAAPLDKGRIAKRIGHPPNTLEKFWASTLPTARGCLEWVGTCFRCGYGRYQYNGKNRLAHRLAWEAKIGPIPDGLFVCHHCDNPRCVNVDHLFLGTALDNNRDAHRKGRAITPACPKERKARGERIGGAKLTEAEVTRIKYALRHGATQASLARIYRVSTGAVHLIAAGRNWKHVVENTDVHA